MEKMLKVGDRHYITNNMNYYQALKEIIKKGDEVGIETALLAGRVFKVLREIKESGG